MKIKIGKYRLPVPRSRAGRLGAGIGLVILGIIPGPPGPAAIPVGLTILTLDHPRGRRWRRIVIVKVGRRWQETKVKRRMRRAAKRGASVGNDLEPGL
ncbi:hypothetical protein Plav_1931 [Parvibaculum lavamentivorans DS-1]|uniref:Transmembrane protein (PGPGW) n=1 Tax=Parvibaculum lavamentivorans (strain DS-1 / DSM 13023 / NCIMB 13966) TaxID=402881 RepID=A7HUG3_PARL1|nr:hypothetical protein [Parvibaculum lavamentivorans]ABS63546.1 hypothetical protein Plav_1931 [Parvibaculum lavamentivorans DS-1]